MKDVRIAYTKKAPADPVNDSSFSSLKMPSETLSTKAKLGINSGMFRGLRLSPCSHRRGGSVGRACRVQYQIATDTFKTGRDKSTANRWAKGVSVTGPRSAIIYGYPALVTVGVASVRTLTAQEPGRVLIIQLFDSHELESPTL